MNTAPEPNAGSADATPSASDYEVSVAEMFGDYTTPPDRETPESDTTSAPGTTPVEPAPETEQGATGATADAGAGAGERKSPTDDPSGAIATAATDAEPSDPFADTTPLTLTVNGQSLPVEGVRVFKEGGAVIKPEALDNIRQRLSERESLQARLHTQSHEYQRLAKVAEWTNPADNTTKTGPEAVVEMRIGLASLYAENRLLLTALTEPDVLTSMLTMEDDGKGGQRIIVDPGALEDLKRENNLQQRELRQKLQEHYRGVVAGVKPAPPPVNYETELPGLLTELARSAQLDATLLTAEDRKVLADILPDHTRDGKVSIKWQGLAKTFMTNRAREKATAAQLVTTTQNATKEAQNRMAAAARGVRAGKPAAPPAKPPAAPSPEAERAANESDLFNTMLRAGASAMRASG